MVIPEGVVAAASDLDEIIRSYAVTQAEKALALLAEARQEGPEKGLPPEVVHALRVTSKRLRAVGQWIRPFLQPEEADVADRRLRDAARGLALAREEHVLAALAHELERASSARGDAVEPDTPGQEEPGAQTESLGVGELEAAFRAEVERWRGLPLALETRELIEIGLGRTLGEVLAKEAGARLSGKAKAFHRWRKWVKYLRYQLEVLEPAPGDPLADALERVHRLGSLLGKHHDLVDLKRRSRSGTGSLSAAAGQHLRRRRGRLEREILGFDSLAHRVAEALGLPFEQIGTAVD